MLDMAKYINPYELESRPDSDEGSKAYTNWRESKRKHEVRQSELVKEFMFDALTELDLIDHPKAYEAFDLAFQERWISSGLIGVYHLLTDIAKLLHD